MRPVPPQPRIFAGPWRAVSLSPRAGRVDDAALDGLEAELGRIADALEALVLIARQPPPKKRRGARDPGPVSELDRERARAALRKRGLLS